MNEYNGAHIEQVSRDSPEYTNSHLGKKIVFGTNMHMIRVGGILKNKILGEERYLLGREELHGEEGQHILKSTGGYLRLTKDRYNVLDKSSIEGLARELWEERFREGYALRKETVTPLRVVLSEEKGVLQFYSARLKGYPGMGRHSEAVFRKLKDRDIYVRWFSVDEIIDMLHNKNPDFDIKPETSWTILLDNYFEKSSKMHFTQGQLPGIVTKKGDLQIPEKAKENLIDRCSIQSLDRIIPLKKCSVYCSVPRDPSAFHRLRLFFMAGIFLYEQEITFEELKLPRRMRSKTKLSGGSATKHVARFIKQNYEKILFEDMVNLYALPDSQ
ncbi:hypothetical protein KY349_04945 [Candidatus Woesearchaeota archaeon]|nr:hypothetical protein [Candidatus Woesearchaeota archaeon]